MPLPQWPSTVPQGPFHGYRVWDDPATVAFDVDAGPAKVRARGTLARERQSTPYECTALEKATIDAFFRSTILLGTQPFEWIHFQTGDVAVLRFKPGTGLAWDQVIGAPDPDKRKYRTTLEFEILPS